MLTLCAGDADKVEAHDKYKQSKKGMKDQIIEQYQNDKSCKWVKSFFSEEKTGTTDRDSTIHGWCSRQRNNNVFLGRVVSGRWVEGWCVCA